MASYRPRGKKPNHWWILTYLTDGRYDRHRFVGTETQAKREATRREGRKLNGQLVPKTPLTVGVFLETWFAKHGEIEESTREGYRNELNHLISALGTIRLADLRVEHIRDFVADAFKSGNQVTGGPLSGKSVRNRIALLYAALKAAEDENKVVAGLRKPVMRKGRAAPRPLEVLTRGEAQAWLRLSADTQDGLAVALALCTGVRRGELLALRRCDVDLDARVLTVRRSVWWRRGQPLWKTPKTANSLRAIELQDRLVELLGRHFAVQDQLHPARENQRDERLVWAHPDGRPYGEKTLTRMPERMVRRYGVRRIRFHDLRHTFATLLLESGVSMNAVSLLLGHADVTITVRLYGHVTPLSQRRVNDVLGDLFRDDDDPPVGEAA